MKIHNSDSENNYALKTPDQNDLEKSPLGPQSILSQNDPEKWSKIFQNVFKRDPFQGRLDSIPGHFSSGMEFGAKGLLWVTYDPDVFRVYYNQHQ